jgi:hypothetical protein
MSEPIALAVQAEEAALTAAEYAAFIHNRRDGKRPVEPAVISHMQIRLARRQAIAKTLALFAEHEGLVRDAVRQGLQAKKGMNHDRAHEVD